MQNKLTPEEQKILLCLAREGIECAVHGQGLTPIHLATLPLSLQEEGSSFVTLTCHGQLRGCIGSLEAYQSLAEDVREHAIGAALKDPRFPPVKEDELNGLQIEISCLTQPVPLEYSDAHDLISRLRPHIDGVILREGSFRRATFLPQVWETIPNPAEFLENLCYKMGADPDLWRRQHLDVLTYQVAEFHE
ncbi:MAG TPA: AmmeMemoRadiSam system protein A [Anaerolineales bacterium]